MTNGHELREWGYFWEGWCKAEVNKREKKRDNCNSIINKIYLKINKIIFTYIRKNKKTV